MMQPGVENAVRRIEELVAQIEAIGDPTVHDRVRELVQALLDVHAGAMTRLLEEVYESDEAGQALIDRLAEDELVGNVLLLHDLHPLGREARVAEALEGIRPYLQSHGGDVELLGVDEDGRVLLRLEGSCDGCASSTATLKYTIEKAVFAAAPDVTAVEVASRPGTDGDDLIMLAEVQWDDCPFPSGPETDGDHDDT